MVDILENRNHASIPEKGSYKVAHKYDRFFSQIQAQTMWGQIPVHVWHVRAHVQARASSAARCILDIIYIHFILFASSHKHEISFFSQLFVCVHPCPNGIAIFLPYLTWTRACHIDHALIWREERGGMFFVWLHDQMKHVTHIEIRGVRLDANSSQIRSRIASKRTCRTFWVAPLG
jgi:hypothetical protein